MGFEPVRPHESEADIGQLSREHLEQIVRIDSQSDENSSTIPSTPGQKELADFVARFFGERGADVERDEHANVIATIAGRGAVAHLPPMALMVHLDTSRGTQAVDKLELLASWDGGKIPYPANPRLRVGLDTYPAVAEFVGQDVLFGPGEAPFGLDDKLGLSHVMTLARLLESNPEIPHPPLLVIGRPDEEIGRMEAVHALAGILADRGVDFGYTVDGILPFEVNVENFNASQAAVTFPDRPLRALPGPQSQTVCVSIGGVNTHGCTAKAEGYRAATRFAAEVLARLEEVRLVPERAVPLRFEADARRDCDATLTMLLGGPDAEAASDATRVLERALEDVIAPHVPRGASWKTGAPQLYDAAATPADAATWDMLRFVQAFMASRPSFVLLAEDSAGREGYTNPYRAASVGGGIRLDIRLRDFEEDGLAAREEHLRQVAAQHGSVRVEIAHQYVNMGPRLADHPELVDWARQAGELLGLDVQTHPIRGGTGVDPFLDRGVPIANLGTGYFAPESEKEFTSTQMMARHVSWLCTLVQVIAAAGPRR